MREEIVFDHNASSTINPTSLFKAATKCPIAVISVDSLCIYDNPRYSISIARALRNTDIYFPEFTSIVKLGLHTLGVEPVCRQHL